MLTLKARSVPQVQVAGRQGRAIIVCALLITLILTLVLVVRPWMGRADEQTGSLEAYRYRFERAPKGAGRQALENEIAFYQARVQRTPSDGLDLAALAGSYIKMARLTGQTQWYLLAEQKAARSLANLPFNNNGAVLVLAKVAEARHAFPEAIRLAGRLAGHPDALAILVTSHLAVGDLARSGAAAETLVSRYPSLGSYALRALVRAARGDDGGTLQDFSRALDAEEPGEQATSAWVRTLIGRLHLHRGRLDRADEVLRDALDILPQYPLALIQLAELETRREHYAIAERHYWTILGLSPGAAYPLVYDHVAMQGLARVYELAGRRDEATQLWRKAEAVIRAHLSAFGHRKELAHLLLERGRAGDLAEAMALIESESQVRQDAETLDVYAWALSEAGKWGQAQRVMQRALDRGAREARFFYRAAAIERALGRTRRADAFVRTATQVDPTFDARARRAFGLSD